MAKGRHSGGVGRAFYRDLGMMLLGILLVGAAVFLLLYLLVGDGSTADTSTTTTESTATSSVPVQTSTTTGIETTTSTAPETTTTTADVPVRPPSEVRVVVLNSVGIAGAAGRLTGDLAGAGYQTLQPDDYEPEQDPSRIWYRDGFSAEGNELLEFVPGALVEPIPDPGLQPGADIVVVLGIGYEE